MNRRNKKEKYSLLNKKRFSSTKKNMEELLDHVEKTKSKNISKINIEDIPDNFISKLDPNKKENRKFINYYIRRKFNI